MRLNWLRDKNTIDKQIKFYWQPGTMNTADYHTKHHAPKHHLAKRSDYILKGFHVQDFVREFDHKKQSRQGCVDLLE